MDCLEATPAMVKTIVGRGRARVKIEPRYRPDGVRGVFATQDIRKDEAAIWVADEEILNYDTVDPEFKKAISSVLEAAVEQGLPREQTYVFERMVALVGGTLLEQAKGSISRFKEYVAALPKAPPTINTFTEKERQVTDLMMQSQTFGLHHIISELTMATIQASVGLWMQHGKPVPRKPEVEAMLYFVMSRMSYVRMIPIIDLANAAFPGEENAAIRENDNGGCALVAHRNVRAGEEVLIDYNHHNAVSMQASYGCSLGMELTRSVTSLKFDVPPFMTGWCRPHFIRSGAQLLEEFEDGIHPDNLKIIRMLSIGEQEEIVAAMREGFFEMYPRRDSEHYERWKAKEKKLFEDVERRCKEALRYWEKTIAPSIGGLSRDSSIGFKQK